MKTKGEILHFLAQATAIEVNNDLKKRREEKIRNNISLSLKEKDKYITEAWLTWQPYLQANKRAK